MSRALTQLPCCPSHAHQPEGLTASAFHFPLAPAITACYPMSFGALVGVQPLIPVQTGVLFTSKLLYYLPPTCHTFAETAFGHKVLKEAFYIRVQQFKKCSATKIPQFLTPAEKSKIIRICSKILQAELLADFVIP